MQEGDMSKTDKTRPWKLQRADGVPWQRIGGVWEGIHYWANRRHRINRRQAKRALQRHEEPEPLPSRHSARWDMY